MVNKILTLFDMEFKRVQKIFFTIISLLILGNRAVMFPGSKVVGNVHVGNNVVIAANSVVINDIPDNCIAVGNPAKVIKTNVSVYNGKF